MSKYMKLLVSFFTTFFGGFATLVAGGINDSVLVMIAGTALVLLGTVLLVRLTNLGVEQRAAYLRGE